jgi:hypothetical protein
MAGNWLLTKDLVDWAGGRTVVFPALGAVAQLGERCNRTAEVRGSIPLSSIEKKLPLGVTGNTPDSGSGESWFEPRRGNGRCNSTGRFLFGARPSWGLCRKRVGSARRRDHWISVASGHRPLRALIGSRGASSPSGLPRHAGPAGIARASARSRSCRSETDRESRPRA